jgi:FtsZ-interacting cell division protein ZipA
MSTGAIIAIVIGVLILLALVVWVSRRSRTKRLESRPDTKGDYEPDRDRTAAPTPDDAQYERPAGTTTPAADPDATAREEHEEERRREYR